jgi:hypothetical protein
MRNDIVWIPCSYTVHAQITATRFAFIDQQAPGGVRREGHLQFLFLGERGSASQPHADWLESDVAISEGLVGANLLTRRAQPTQAGANDLVAICP